MGKAELHETVTAKKPVCKIRLSPSAQEFLADRTNELPVWVRAPKTGPEFYSGFSRPKLYQLAGENKIRSVSIREPGKLTGVRLFHLASILQFIEQCEQAALAEIERVKGKGAVSA